MDSANLNFLRSALNDVIEHDSDSPASKEVLEELSKTIVDALGGPIKVSEGLEFAGEPITIRIVSSGITLAK